MYTGANVDLFFRGPDYNVQFTDRQQLEKAEINKIKIGNQQHKSTTLCWAVYQ